MPRQLEQDFIPDDPTARHISTFRFPFTPGREFTKDRGRLWLELSPPSYTLIAFLRFAPSLADRPFETCKLFVRPWQPSKLRLPAVQMIMNRQEKGHILQRIGQLLVR
jgi:hypothetical protein